MSKSDTTENDSCDETWAMRQQGRGLVAARRSSCRCGRCKIYRFYPPLLVFSTALTGVFCFLYLTKPVLQDEPVMRVHDGGEAPLQNHMIVDAAPADEETAEIRPGLDPGLGMLSDEAIPLDPVVAALSQPEPLDVLDVPGLPEPAPESAPEPEPEPAPEVVRDEPMPVRVSVARRSEDDSPAVPMPGGFKPLRVDRSNAPLFQSLTKSDLARLEAEKAASKAAADEGADAGEVDEIPVGTENGDSESNDTLLAGGGDDEAESGDSPDEAPLLEDAVDSPSEPLDAVVAAILAQGDGEPLDGMEEAGSEASGDAPEKELILRASLIGEFFEDEEGDEEEGQDMLNTAMR